jgi:hypothetical protein
MARARLTRALSSNWLLPRTFGKLAGRAYLRATDASRNGNAKVTRRRCKSACKTSLAYEARVKKQRQFEVQESARPKMIRRLAREGMNENGMCFRLTTRPITPISTAFHASKRFKPLLNLVNGPHAGGLRQSALEP